MIRLFKHFLLCLLRALCVCCESICTSYMVQSNMGRSCKERLLLHNFRRKQRTQCRLSTPVEGSAADVSLEGQALPPRSCRKSSSQPPNCTGTDDECSDDKAIHALVSRITSERVKNLVVTCSGQSKTLQESGSIKTMSAPVQASIATLHPKQLCGM